MKKKLLTLCPLLALLCLSAGAQTTYKVDINLLGRPDTEVTEPEFTGWSFPKDCYEATLQVGDATFVVSSEKNIRGGWSKVFVQNKEQNSRLTGDGCFIDPNQCGSISLTITGLQAGHHNIQTYHSTWEDPANFAAYPITLSLQGEVVYKSVERTLQQPTAAEATMLLTEFDVSGPDDTVILTFSTFEDDLPANAAERTKFDYSPVLNGFVIDGVNTSAQAKRPNPSHQDYHIDADNGEYTLSWEAASPTITEHRLYLGTSPDRLELVQSSAATEYKATGLTNLCDYYWRVDEVAANGTVTEGLLWEFRPRHLAFPGAEGYGRWANGGRGGMVYHVTNLNDDNLPGSFRYGVENLSGRRTIVFDVSGLIHLRGKLQSSNPYLTVAGQTAPGKGICFSGAAIGFTTDNIIRHIRNRVGTGPTSDGMGFRGADHAIMDHCSISWSIDEGFSSREAGNITLQRTMIAEALNIAAHDKYDEGSQHGFAAVFGGDIGSFHHNLLTQNSGRNPRLDGGQDGSGAYKGRLDIFNNVVYNWYRHPAYGESHQANFHNNYYKMGPATTKQWILVADVNQRGSNKGTEAYYFMNNVLVRKDGSVVFDGTKHGNGTNKNVDGGMWQLVNDMPITWDVWVSEPFYPSEAKVETAWDAYKSVLSDVGCSQPATDDHDLRMIHETLTGTAKYRGSLTKQPGIIDTEDDAGGFEIYPEISRPADFDTDQDGLPNWFENIWQTSNQSTEGDYSDANKLAGDDGYTLMDTYLNFLAEPHLLMTPGEERSIYLPDLFIGYTKQPRYSVELQSNDFTVSLSDNGMLTVKASAQANSMATGSVTVTDSEGATFTRQLGIAIADTATAAEAIEPTTLLSLVKSIEIYSLDGKLISAENATTAATIATLLQQQSLSTGVYIIKTTDVKGNQTSSKIVKR